MAVTWKKLAFEADVIKHSLATAANDFLVASGSGVFVKKTLAETKAILSVPGPAVPPRGGTFYNSTGIPNAAINMIVWYVTVACTLTNIRGYRVGGSGATINARRNGADNGLASALSLSSANTWMDGGAVQNTAYAVGDKLEIMLVSTAGSPTQVAIQIDFSVP